MEEHDTAQPCPMESYPTSSEQRALDRFCRLCMRENPFLLPFHAILRDITLSDMLERILGMFKIRQTSGLPNGVCPHCITKLDYAFNVQLEFVRNEQRLKHYVQHGNLVAQLFEYQSKSTTTKGSYADRILKEHGNGVLLGKTVIDPKQDVPDIREGELIAAKLFKSMVPSGGWQVVACDCSAKPLSGRILSRANRTANPPKRTLQNRQILRQTIVGESPSGTNYTVTDPSKCYICGTETESEEALRNHLAEHVDMLPYHCPKCGKTETDDDRTPPIKSLTMLHRHHRMHSYPLQCPHCPQRFMKYTAVYAHVRNRHERVDNPEGYTCDICGVTMRYRPSFMYHMRIHYHEQNGTFRCQYCERVFGTRARLERHERSHTGERPFACHLCSKTFVHSGLLATHIARHNNERGHKCVQCGKAFFNKAMLRQHLESHEPVANRKATSETNVRQRPCTYPGCGYVARTYQRYYMHRLRHEMAHRCEECGKRFARLCELRRHRRIYHSTEQPFRCETCCKSFLSSQSYREHMDSHANVRRYECDICDKKFVRRRTLVNHRTSHTNDRRYQCEDCASTFKYKSDFNRHRKDKHDRTEAEEVMETIHEGDIQEIVLMTEDPVTHEMLQDGVVQPGILLKENIVLDGTYGDVIETVEETIVVEQPLVSIEIDGEIKEEYIIEYMNQS